MLFHGKTISQWRTAVATKRLSSSRVALPEELRTNWIPEVDFNDICDISTIEALEVTPYYLIMGNKAPEDAEVELHRNRLKPLNIREDGTFEGVNSVVFKAVMFQPRALDVVIKGCLPLDTRLGYEGMFEGQTLEAKILSALPEHPNLVPILHSFSGSSALVYPWVPSIFHELGRNRRMVRHKTTYFVFPFCERTLKSKYDGSSPIEEREVLLDVLQVVHALAHLSENRIVHCDIKSDNFFMSGEGFVLLGDFGCARRLVSATGDPIAFDDADQMPIGPQALAPPEFIAALRRRRNSDARFDTMEKVCGKYDMFGAGRMFVELLSGTDMTMSDPPIEECLSRLAYSAELVDILRSMVHVDAERRCSAEELSDVIGALLWPPPRGCASDLLPPFAPRVALPEELRVNWVPFVDFDRISDRSTIEALERTPYYMIVGNKAPADSEVRLHRNRLKPLNLREDGTLEGVNAIVFKAVMLQPRPLDVVIRGYMPIFSGPNPNLRGMLDEQAREARIRSALPEHPNLVPILHSFSGSSALVYPWVPSIWHDYNLVQEQTTYYVFPFYESTLTAKYSASAVEEREVLLDILQVAHVLQHLQAHHVVHCKIRSRCFFLSEEGTLLLGRFGCARRLVSATGDPIAFDDADQMPIGPQALAPPEFIAALRRRRNSDARFDTMEKVCGKYDMFGAGRMFVELLSGTDMTMSDPPIEECLSRLAYSAELVDILRCMAHADAERRCSAEELGERVGALLCSPSRGAAGVSPEWLSQRWLEYCVDGKVTFGDGNVMPTPEVHVFAWQSLRTETSSESAVGGGRGAVESKF